MTSDEAMKKAMAILDRAGEDLCKLVDDLSVEDGQVVAARLLEMEMKIAYDHGVNAANVLAKVREQVGICGPGEAQPLPPFKFEHKYVEDAAGNKHALLVNPQPFVDRCHEGIRYAFGSMPVNVEIAVGLGTGLAIALTEHCTEHGGSASELLAIAHTYVAQKDKHHRDGTCPSCNPSSRPAADPNTLN